MERGLNRMSNRQGKKPITLWMPEETHSELKEGCNKLSMKMTPFIVNATMQELRKLLKLREMMDRNNVPDYSNR